MFVSMFKHATYFFSLGAIVCACLILPRRKDASFRCSGDSLHTETTENSVVSMGFFFMAPGFDALETSNQTHRCYITLDMYRESRPGAM